MTSRLEQEKELDEFGFEILRCEICGEKILDDYWVHPECKETGE